MIKLTTPHGPDDLIFNVYLESKSSLRISVDMNINEYTVSGYVTASNQKY
jgi:hypothetical protein